MRIFLGGTFNESTWRKRFIALLDKHIDYFNPVDPDLAINHRHIENKGKNKCNILLYTITPFMTGVYSIAEAVEASNKCPEKTHLILLKSDDNKIFDEGEWRSLLAMEKLVVTNGGVSFYRLEDAAYYFNEYIANQSQSQY